MLTVGLFPNTKKPDVTPVLAWLARHFAKRNVKVLMPEHAARELNFPEWSCDRMQLKEQINLGITLGGDGTLLNTARDIASAGIPVCGINMGQLGFLTELELSDLGDSIDKLIDGDYYIEERLMLEAAVIRKGEEVFVSPALNDVVVNKGGFSRPIWLQVYIDGELTAKFTADGLIVATPTGSTGYSLSAGGPIINPSLKVILVTPVCPHTLHARPLVVSEQEEVTIALELAYNDAALTIDGQNLCAVKPEDIVLVRRSPFRGRFIRLNGRNYANSLRAKLWQDNDD